jgi:hypothetical protein
VPGRKIHAAAEVNHGALQDIGELDQMIDARLAAGAAIRYDHRVRGIDEERGCFRERTRITDERSGLCKLRNDELLVQSNRPLL